VAVAVTAAKARPRLLAEVLGPLAEGFVAAHPAEGRTRRWPAPRARDVGKKVGESTHLFGAQQDLLGSMTIVGAEYRTRQVGWGVQRTGKDALGGVRLGAVALGCGESRGCRPPHASCGPVERAVEATRIDEGLQQQQWVAETLPPVPCQAAFAQGQHAGGEVRVVVLGQDQKATVVGDQMQKIILVAKSPPDPGVTRRALPDRGGEAHKGQPLPLPGGDIPQGMAGLRQRPEVVMGPPSGPRGALLHAQQPVVGRSLGASSTRSHSGGVGGVIPALPGVFQNQG
jgi:hypothetical protein